MGNNEPNNLSVHGSKTFFCVSEHTKSSYKTKKESEFAVLMLYARKVTY